MFKRKSKSLALSGIIAALYVVLSFATLPITSGAVQVRIAESLTVLTLFFPEAVLGVFVGCFITNFLAGCSLIDIIFGSIITLDAAALNYAIGKRFEKSKLKFFIGSLITVVLNSFLLPLVWYLEYGILEYAYLIQVLLVFLGESISVFGIGCLVYKGTEDLIKEKLQ